MSLRFRIAATIFALEVLLVLGVLFVTLQHMLETSQAQLAAKNEAMVSLLDDLGRLALLTDEYAELQAFIEESAGSRLEAAALIDLAGRVVAASDPGRIGQPFAPVPLDERAQRQLVELGEYGAGLGLLEVIFSDADLIAAHEQAYRLGLATAAGGMVVIAVVGLTMGHLLTRRLSRLAQVADRVAGGETALRSRLSGRDEVARVSKAMDGMLDRLETHLHDVTLARDRLVQPTEAMSDGFAIWDVDDRLVLCNRRFRELHAALPITIGPGIPFDQLIGLVAEHLIDRTEVTAEGWIAAWSASHREGHTDVEVPLIDGRWLRVAEWRMADGGTVGICTEITEAKLREKALAESEERLRVVMDSVGEGIATLDPEGRIEAVNHAMEMLLEQPAEALVGGRFDEWVTWPEGTTEDNLWRAIDGDPPPPGISRLELVARRRTGHVPVDVGWRRVAWRGRPMFIATLRDITEQKHAHAAMLHQATHDPLTGLPNRALFDDRLDRAIEEAKRASSLVAVMLLDLDRFKSINDTLGHAAGDELLVAVAQRLRGVVRGSDTVARMAGDEFVLVMPQLDSMEQVARPARKLLDCLREPLEIQGQALALTASLGIALYPEHGPDRPCLLKHADTALYRAKERGRNDFAVFDPSMNAVESERALLEADLRRSLARNELTLVYQPQFDIATGRPVALEALLRWTHPIRGNISPANFIPLAEETGLIGSIGAWVLNRACADLAGWHRQRIKVPRLAVNVSPRQLNEALFDQVEQNLLECGIDSHCLELELTETALLQDQVTAVATVKKLRSLGIGLALDDFGTGYSSLSNLRHYPVQRVKIDRSFIRDITSDRGDAALSRAVIELARGLTIKVVAEGIETEQQLDLLRQFGCDEGQGFYLGRPCDGGRIPELFGAKALA